MIEGKTIIVMYGGLPEEVVTVSDTTENSKNIVLTQQMDNIIRTILNRMEQIDNYEETVNDISVKLDKENYYNFFNGYEIFLVVGKIY